MTSYSGGCHCGRIQFRVSAEPSEVSVCNGSICSMKGFVHWLVKPEQFELLSGADDLSVYTFNTGVAKHTFCKQCGIHSFYTPRSDQEHSLRDCSCPLSVAGASRRLHTRSTSTPDAWPASI